MKTSYDGEARWLVMQRSDDATGARALLVCNFADKSQAIPVGMGDGCWRLRLWSGAERYGAAVPEPEARIASGVASLLELVGNGAALYVTG